MKILDFPRSFVTFRIDLDKVAPQTVSHKPPYSLNNARIQIDCCCTIQEKESGQTQIFVMGANCKTERVCVERDIWTEPNADFVPIFSDSDYLLLKTFARTGTTVDLYPPGSGQQSDRQTGRVNDTFDRVTLDLRETGGRLLTSAEEIVAATLSNERLIARTILDNVDYMATIEYPIRTMNANERDQVYQLDTGPVLLPDLSGKATDLISGFELAFVAFNQPSWAEFLVRRPTKIDEGVHVYHYSQPMRLNSTNQVLVMGG